MYRRFGKRCCDLVVGIIALPFVLVLIAVLGVMIHAGWMRKPIILLILELPGKIARFANG